MTIEELLKRAREQPAITVEQVVSVHGAQLEARLAEGTPMLLSELAAHPDQRQELRTFRYGHVLGPGLGRDAVDAWQASHPHHPLPSDLRELLARIDGINLWADLATSRGYFGILPLDEWQDVRDGDLASLLDEAPEGLLTISYHENGDYLLALDTNGRQYLWYDLEDVYHPLVAGRTVAELLDFWWEESAWLDPRAEAR